MENKRESRKYRTFELYDNGSMLNITDLESNLMEICRLTSLFGHSRNTTIYDDGGGKDRTEFLNKCYAIGYLFSGDYSSMKNIILYNSKDKFRTGKTLFIRRVLTLLSLYNSFKMETIIEGRFSSITSKKYIKELAKKIKEEQRKLIYIDDLNERFSSFIDTMPKELYKVIDSERIKGDISFCDNYVPIIVSCNFAHEFRPGCWEDAYIKCEFSLYDDNDLDHLFWNNGISDYIQDLKFCMDCLDYYKDFNNDIV